MNWKIDGKMNVKAKILAFKLGLLFASIILFFLPGMINGDLSKVKLVDEDLEVLENNSSYDWTDIDITLEFDRDLWYDGWATISFYDEAENLIETKEVLFHTGNLIERSKKAFGNCTVYGKADAYEIESYDFSAAPVGLWIYLLWLISVPVFIFSLFLSYKEYQYNGKKVSAYAGWFHQTLEVGGEKCDEHIGLLWLTSLKLSTTLEDGTVIDCQITPTRRITAKANNKLLSKFENRS